MSSMRSSPVRCRTASYALRACAAAVALAAAGCASTDAAHQQAYQTSNSRPVYPGDPFIAPQTVARAPSVVMEDDGLPSQLPPLHAKTGPDDPTEPFSPNYGSVPPTRQADATPDQPIAPGPASPGQPVASAAPADRPTAPRAPAVAKVPERVASLAVIAAPVGYRR